MTGTTRTLITAAGFGALAGMRSLAAPALLSHELAQGRMRAGHGAAARLFSAPVTSRTLGILAAGEMAADKAPWIPARIDPVPLAGRALLGALGGALIASQRGGASSTAAILGAAAAVGVATAMYTLRRLARRRLPFPDTMLGLAEDGLVLALGARLRSALR